MDVLEDLTQLIESILATLIAALALAWTIIAYWLNKRNALALERTKFIFENLRFFETDPLMQMANQVVNGLVADFTIDAFLNIRKAGGGTPEQITKCMALDNYLNFLWRIAYAHLTLKTITINDLDAFGYYFFLISQHEGLMRYCVYEGFEEIIDAIEKLRPIWDKTETENDYRRKVIAKLVADNAVRRQAA
jgi:hypothetical protein